MDTNINIKNTKEIVISNSVSDTIAAGQKFAQRLKPGDVVLFYGELGVGKTEFIKAICGYYSVKEIITSPTFTIVNEYEGLDTVTSTSTGANNNNNNKKILKILHIDLYRIRNFEELVAMGFEDYLHLPDAIKFIEWAENSFGFIKKFDYSVSIIADEENEEKRQIEIL